MKRFISFCIITTLSLTGAAACGGKTPPQKAAKQGKNVLSSLRGLKDSYENKNLDSFLMHVSGGYPDRKAFADSVAGVFKKYKGIRFNFQYRKMMIMTGEKGPIKAALNWDGEWQSADGSVHKDGGRATMIFDPGEFTLASVEGKNPFVPAEKQK